MRKTKSQLDLNLLVAFDTLMTERSVTRSGQVLGITQAAMSNTLRRLRDTFDNPLFIKKGAQMEPTPRAMELSIPITKALYHVGELLNNRDFIPENSTHLFRIAIVECLTSTVLHPLLSILSAQAPNISITVLNCSENRQTSLLDRGEADLVISWFNWMPPKKIQRHHLFKMDFVCLSRRGNPLTNSSSTLTLEKFINARHVQYYPQGMDRNPVDESLEKIGKSRKIVTTLSASNAIPQLISRSDLLTVLPRKEALLFQSHFPLNIHPLPFETEPLEIAMSWHKRTDTSLPDIWLREQIKQLATKVL
ncbi:MAG: LysR family transcriptional regulator [Magnetococcales bacterium]|nr:LysR family transcriptional regulator [Magnetococcales bacterium]